MDAAKDDVKKADEKKAAEAKKAADEAAAKKVVDLINALPANAGVGDKDAVTAARAAYDALTDDQKKLVSGDVLAKLTTAEAQVQAAEEKPRSRPPTRPPRRRWLTSSTRSRPTPVWATRTR